MIVSCVSEAYPWTDLTINRQGIIVADADTKVGALYEHARVDQCLARTLLNTKVYDVSLLCGCVVCVDERELEHAKVEFSHPQWTTGGAQILLDLRHGCGFKWVCTRRVEHFEHELVPVDDNSKVMPRVLKKRSVEQNGAIARTDSEHMRVSTRNRRIEWCPNLEIEVMRPVTRLYPHGLVLVCVVQRPSCVRMHGEMECRYATLKYRIEQCTISVLVWLRDDLAAAETQLWRAAPRSEDRRVVDDDADGLLIGVPYRSRAVGAAEKLEVVTGILRPFHTAEEWTKRFIDIYLSVGAWCTPFPENRSRPGENSEVKCNGGGVASRIRNCPSASIRLSVLYPNFLEVSIGMGMREHRCEVVQLHAIHAIARASQLAPII